MRVLAQVVPLNMENAPVKWSIGASQNRERHKLIQPV